MRLVNTKTGQELAIGDKVTTNDGEVGTLVDITKPKHGGSTGRVAVKLDGAADPNWTNYWYPNVVNAEWIEREDR